jgi:tRNA pseudouridine38-40 synthase
VAPERPSILLTVAYDGASFFGFAPQREGRTVHGVLTDAIRSLDPGAGKLRGASRTDSGVHARGQAVAFDPSRTIPPKGWVLGVNAALPTDVAVRAAREVMPGFEPRAHGRGKRYRYGLMVDRVRDPLEEARRWRIDPPFDLAAARAEGTLAIGTHDFRAFRTASDPRVDTVRTLGRVDVVEIDARALEIVVEGSAFLHNMVRILVGAIVDVARGRLRPGAIARALASGARADLGITAPAHGLLLDEVFLELEPAGAAWP